MEELQPFLATEKGSEGKELRSSTKVNTIQKKLEARIRDKFTALIKKKKALSVFGFINKVSLLLNLCVNKSNIYGYGK